MTDDPADKRRLVNRFLRAAVDPWLDWLYWRLDLLDEHKRPDHGKVFGMVSFFWGLVILWGLRGDLTSNAALLPWWLAFASLVFLAPFGLRGIVAWLKSRGGGAVDATGQAATAAAQAVLDRRAQSDGTYEASP